MVMCWAPDCKHYNERETCKFYRFPKDLKLRNKWKRLIRRDVEPGADVRICSCHFKDGNKENLPTLFSHNREKMFTSTSPERKLKKRERNVNLMELQDVTNVDHNVEPQPSTSQVTDAAPTTVPMLSPTQVDAENYFLQKAVKNLTEKQDSLMQQFSHEHIKKNDKLVLLYTGLPNAAIFEALCRLLENQEINYYLNWRVEKISRQDQLLLTLMKLRQNFPQEDLALRFNLSQASVSNIILTWIHVLHETLFEQLMSNIPSRQKNKLCLPSSFATFTNCRIIVDCTEVFTAVPRKSMKVQRLTYSHYKHRNTWKLMIGVAPNGCITYVSDLYPGSTSDKRVTKDCGILHHLEAGDLILADKGFLIKDILPAGVSVNIPPFLETAQFTPEQVQQTESIARARIHVERAIRRMKSYNILNFIPHTLLPHADIVCQVVASLTNLQHPLIKQVEEFYTDSE